MDLKRFDTETFFRPFPQQCLIRLPADGNGCRYGRGRKPQQRERERRRGTVARIGQVHQRDGQVPDDRGGIDDLDESEEINACSVKMTVNVDGVDEPWLLQYKNETHNHPTEIEPFGGASSRRVRRHSLKAMSFRSASARSSLPSPGA